MKNPSRIATAAGIALLVFGTGAITASAAPYKFKTLQSYCADAPTCTNGVNPQSGLVLDASGNLYGTTLSGGSGFGTVFELTRSATGFRFKILYKFCSQLNCTDGVSPKATLIMDTAGNLYGTASGGGDRGKGIVFELTPGKRWKFKRLYSFCAAGGSCADGSHPAGSETGASGALTYVGAAWARPYDGVSQLFGTTVEGGANGAGVAYALAPNGTTWMETVLYDFCSQPNCGDGQQAGNLIARDAQRLYGTTASGHGSVFLLTPASPRWSLATLHTFCPASGCADGDVPNALALDANGNFFGLTSAGGTGTQCSIAGGCGVAFELSFIKHGGWQESVLYNFCSLTSCSDGAQPSPGLLLDAADDVFGTTNLGGSSNCFSESQCGTAFRIQGSLEQVMHTFCPKAGCSGEGTTPEAAPVMDSSGNLYGTTSFGGAYGGGTVYQLKPAG
ncbi:MAG TPA: choice-of-anchor tandem repeat GloVer-containing protein [Rhizomicrobium sp.]